MSQPDNIVPFQKEKPAGGPSILSMKSELVEKAAEIITDPQVLVNIVSARVTQLNNGSAPRVPTLPSMGAADIALLEVIKGKVTFARHADDMEEED